MLSFPKLVVVLMHSHLYSPMMVRSATMDSWKSQQSFKITEVDGMGRVLVHGDASLPPGDKPTKILPSPLASAARATPLPKPLQVDFDMPVDIIYNAAQQADQSSYLSSDQYAYKSSFPINHSLITPPQSVDLDKQHSYIPSHPPPVLAAPEFVQHGQATITVPFYPDKERFQSSWKFPLNHRATNVGLNLSTAPPVHLGKPSPPLSAVHSSFPSMNSLNGSLATVAMHLDTTAQAETRSDDQSRVLELEKRQSRIQAWLESPDSMVKDDSAEDSWSTLPKEWVDRDDAESSMISTDTSMSESASSLDLSLRPSTFSASAMQRNASNLFMHRYDDYEEVQGLRVSGKSVQPLRISRKRRLEEEAFEESDSDRHRSGTTNLSGSPVRSVKSSVNGTREMNSPNKRIGKGSGQDPAGSPNKKAVTLSSVGMEKNASSSSRRGIRRKGKAGRKTGTVGCVCEQGDDGEAMVQCDKCTSWFHLPCLELDDHELGEEWFCFRCSGGPLPGPLKRMLERANGRDDFSASAAASSDLNMMHQSAYPSPSSPTRQPLDLAEAAKITPTPSTPKWPSVLREPTFTHSNTPKVDYKRHFQDSSLVLAPSPHPGVIPVTPSRNASDFIPGHTHTQSLSRQYAPFTPRVGYSGFPTPLPSSIAPYSLPFGSADHSAAGTYLTYSPHSPSVNMMMSSRRPSKHFRTPSNLQQFQWEELPSRREDDSERARQWGLFYGDGDNNDNTLPSTPPTSNLPPADFLPLLDPDEAARQRFLELNSTPSRWGDSQQRFPSISWT